MVNMIFIIRKLITLTVSLMKVMFVLMDTAITQLVLIGYETPEYHLI